MKMKRWLASVETNVNDNMQQLRDKEDELLLRRLSSALLRLRRRTNSIRQATEEGARRSLIRTDEARQADAGSDTASNQGAMK